MTPAERNIVRSLIAVAWADGKLNQQESGVIEGLLCGFDASEEEERELLQYARTPRTLEADIPFSELTRPDRELLFANAALLIGADGQHTAGEARVLAQLARLLGFESRDVAKILDDVKRTAT